MKQVMALPLELIFHMDGRTVECFMAGDDANMKAFVFRMEMESLKYLEI